MPRPCLLTTEDLGNFVYKRLRTNIEGGPLVVILGLDFKDRGACFINSISASLGHFTFTKQSVPTLVTLRAF
jgi:hypothetical protein